MIAELKLDTKYWTQVIDSIQTHINEAPTGRLVKNFNGSARSPFEMMTGISSRRAILKVLRELEIPQPTYSMTRAAAERLLDIEKIQTTMEAVHKDVCDRI